MSATQEAASDLLFTTDDLSAMPDDGKRYEIIEGELYVSTQPNWHHQYACTRLLQALENWDEQTGLGVANGAPGVIFSVHDAVAPDVVWVSFERLSQVLGEDGKLHAAPDLVVEVVSPGWQNEQRDRNIKLKLYSRRGVREYWIIDWQARQVEVYHRNQAKPAHTVTLLHEDELTSPLLPGVSCKVSTLFMQIPPAPKA